MTVAGRRLPPWYLSTDLGGENYQAFIVAGTRPDPTTGDQVQVIACSGAKYGVDRLLAGIVDGEPHNPVDHVIDDTAFVCHNFYHISRLQLAKGPEDRRVSARAINMPGNHRVARLTGRDPHIVPENAAPIRRVVDL